MSERTKRRLTNLAILILSAGCITLAVKVERLERNINRLISNDEQIVRTIDKIIDRLL